MPPPAARKRAGAIVKKKTAEEAKATPGVEGGLLVRKPSASLDQRSNDGRGTPKLASLKDLDPKHDLHVHEHDLQIEKEGGYSHAGAGLFASSDTDTNNINHSPPVAKQKRV